ncbi:tRNA(fMet)-specific endonuclease VapC [vapC] [Acididesulfobacillus acetoxydans]|uniref:Ribonuclease VapC n=1 Tax=Acididesulfobacillus acetoxydans TaxID=1561005 RepID=A0A8S0X5B9_9FIRM|nr:type II toxin-antitoxin system VapC family toxin [Acididesulfobacillus acetoxydans]CAA7601500.1 tRNA(fMet)-specific endonuclease VapC [vapC] [Acididesulfobacillus acetoxydans]CEJ06987.1 PilT protein domain protein [Acididesulfobacillus acetoxydans]
MRSNGFLLDTTLLIDFLRGREEAVAMLNGLVEEGPLACCPVTVAELFSGAGPDELHRIEELFDALVYHPIDYRTARRAGLYRRDYQRKGITLSISDTLIAAVAVENSLTFLTKNVRHFPMPELAVIEYS